jgi:hypothetical protein
LLTRIKQDCYEYPECSQQDFYPPPPSVSGDNNNGLGAVGGVAGVQDPAAVRREANRLQQRRRLANESPDKRAARLESQRIQQQLRLASESTDQRATRLLALRERQRFRLAHESPNQRASRLTALRDRQRIRLATESNDQRSKRLESLRFCSFCYFDLDPGQQNRGLWVQFFSSGRNFGGWNELQYKTQVSWSEL